MKNKFKKFISIFLAVLLLCSIMIVGTISASATSKTADQAISWCQSNLGKGVEYSIDEWRYQCVDFIQAYYSYLGVSPSYGNGCDYATNTVPAGWTRTKGGTPQKGDILVYTGGYGHVAIHESNNVSYHQNWNYSYVQKVNRPYNQSYTVTEDNKKVTKTYWGCIHPNFIDNSVPPITVPTGSQTISDGEYHIVSALNESYGLNIAYDSKDNGANVQLYNNMGDDNTSSLVTVKYIGSGYYTLTFKNSGKLLDVANGGTENGTNVWQCNSNSSNAQKWVIKESGDGYFYIVSKCNGLFLDVTNGVVNNSTNIRVCIGNNSKAQKWRFIASGKSTGQTVSDGEYHVVSALNESYGLNVAYDSKDTGANVQLYNNMGDENTSSLIVVKYVGSGYYTMTFKNSGKLLDVADGGTKGTTNGTNVWQCTSNSSNAQKWIIKESGDGYFYIISKCNGLFLDVTNGVVNNSTNIRVCIGNNTKAQKWKFVKRYEAQSESKPTELSSSESNPTEPTNPAYTAKISKTKASVKAGGTVTLKVTNGTVKNWSTSNKKVAAVSNGKITGLKKGDVTITATLKTGKKITCKVTVTTSPKLSKPSVTVKKNKTVSVKITGKASTVNNVYTNTKIAKITSKNTATTLKVKGLKKGTTTLKVKVNGVALKLKVKVK